MHLVKGASPDLATAERRTRLLEQQAGLWFYRALRRLRRLWRSL